MDETVFWASCPGCDVEGNDDDDDGDDDAMMMMMMLLLVKTMTRLEAQSG